MCPWLERVGVVLEPQLSLPIIIVSTWIFLLLQGRIALPAGIVLGVVAVILATVLLAVFCMVWVWLQRKDEEERTEEPGRS